MFSILAFLFALPHHSFCISPSLATRTGSESCWVQFHLDPNRRICLSYTLWQEWLKTSPPPLICANPSDKWKTSTHLRNSTESPLSDSPHFKPIIYTQYLRTLPGIKSEFLRVQFFIQKIEKLRERASKLIAPSDPLGIARLLMLRENQPQSKTGVFRKLGFVHLLSASGIHLYAIAQVWSPLICRFCNFVKIPIQIGLWVNRLLHFSFCTIIWLMNGGHLGMLRPWGVLLMRGGARFLGFRWKKLSPLLLAIALDLTASVLKTETTPSGRWVYALAVGGGLIWCESFKSAHIGLAIGSWIGVAIWEIGQSSSISLATPLISLITLPVTCLLIYPFLLISILANEIGLHSLSQSFSQNLLEGLYTFIAILTRAALIPGNLWSVQAWTLLPSFIIATLTLYFRSFRARMIFSILCTLSIFGFRLTQWFQPSMKVSHSAKKIEQLDVGQGDSALVIGNRPNPIDAGLIDTGSKRAISSTQWLDIFAERGIHQLSWVAISHLDEDHSGGLLNLASLISIDCIVAPDAEIQSPRGQRLNKKLSQYGLQIKGWQSNCIPYPHYSVQNHFKRHNPRARNQNMGAIWIPLEKEGFYFTSGDANASDEEKILQWSLNIQRDRSLNSKRPRILKVSHHGSRYSSSLDFLKKLNPTEAWISVGIRNSYGHPSIEVLNKLQKQGIPIRRTDREGAISKEGDVPHPQRIHLP